MWRLKEAYRGRYDCVMLRVRLYYVDYLLIVRFKMSGDREFISYFALPSLS